MVNDDDDDTEFDNLYSAVLCFKKTSRDHKLRW